MNLFDGSENYVLRSFKAASSDNARDGVFDLPLLSIVLSKATDVADKPNKEENIPNSSLYLNREGYGVAADNAELAKVTIVMRVTGVGRFYIKTMAARQKTFELFKNTVLNTKYFNLEVKIVADPPLDHGTDKVSFTDRFMSFRTNFYSVIFTNK